jgi:hypothetical protein
MQSAEEFMRDFFFARTAQIKKELENRVPFRQKFFTDDCFWDSRNGVIELNESESIISITDFDNEVEVVTQQAEPFPRLRYHLQKVGQSWLIRGVDAECLSCGQARGNAECVFCNGTGWLPDKSQLERIKLRKKVIRGDIPPPRQQF